MKRQPTPAQKQAAEERRAAFRSLAGKIAAMTPEERASFAARVPAIVTIDGHVISQHNQCLLISQRDGVTMIGGFQQWKQAGRIVCKGEHGLGLFAPKSPKADPNKQRPGEISSKDLDSVHFIMVTVFDVSQTRPLGEGETVTNPDAPAEVPASQTQTLLLPAAGQTTQPNPAYESWMLEA